MESKTETFWVVVALLIFLYTLWYISTHSESLTLGDLIAGISGMTASFGIFISIIIKRIYNQLDKMDGKIDDIKDRFDSLNQKVSKLSGSFRVIEKIFFE